jgi:hypothetical protein
MSIRKVPFLHIYLVVCGRWEMQMAIVSSQDCRSRSGWCGVCEMVGSGAQEYLELFAVEWDGKRMTATMVLTVSRWPSTTVLMIGEGLNIVDLGKRIFFDPVEAERIIEHMI